MSQSFSGPFEAKSQDEIIQLAREYAQHIVTEIFGGQFFLRAVTSITPEEDGRNFTLETPTTIDKEGADIGFYVILKVRRNRLEGQWIMEKKASFSGTYTLFT